MARRSAWGSIQAAGPGIWRLRYPLPNDPGTGKRRQGYETVHGTKKDASKRLAELRIEHDRFRASPAVMTVSRLWGSITASTSSVLLLPPSRATRAPTAPR